MTEFIGLCRKQVEGENQRAAAVRRSGLRVAGRLLVRSRIAMKTSVRVQLETVSSDAAIPVWFIRRGSHGDETTIAPWESEPLIAI